MWWWSLSDSPGGLSGVLQYVFMASFSTAEDAGLRAEEAVPVDETALLSSYSIKTHKFGGGIDDVIIRSIKKDTYGSKLNLTGCAVWHAGEVFSKFLVDNQALFKGKSCLELGAGAGLTGIVMCKVQGDDAEAVVVLTDGEPEVLALLRSNCEDNGTSATVQLSLLLWGVNAASRLLLAGRPQGYECIYGCDLFYNRTQEDKVALAFDTVAALLTHDPCGRFYLGFTRRDLDINTVLAIALAKGFTSRVLDECTWDVFNNNTDGLTDLWRDAVFEFRRCEAE